MSRYSNSAHHGSTLQQFEISIFSIIGEVLRGDRIVNTPYEVRMAQDVKCRVLCNQLWSFNQQNIIMNRITHDYYVHLCVCWPIFVIFVSALSRIWSVILSRLVDNLPCATRITNPVTDSVTFEHGYKLGYVKDKNVYIHNHLKLIFHYHQVNNR